MLSAGTDWTAGLSGTCFSFSLVAPLSTSKNCGSRRGAVMLFLGGLGAIGLNWGWCWASAKRHVRTLSALCRFFFACWLEEGESPTCCEPRTLLTRDPPMDNSRDESDACDKVRNSMILLTFLWHGWHSFISKPSDRQTWFLSRLKIQGLLKLLALCYFSRREYQQDGF